MEVFPALKGKLGSWSYYTVKMSARELAGSVKFAHDFYEDHTLSEAIQRVLNEGRVNKEIVQYLQRQPDRFFSSIVIAALNGNPKFWPVEMTDDPRFDMLKDDQRLTDAFGVLAFDGTQIYYALDGQHRLAAIKTLLDRDNPASDGAPPDFGADEFSVILVVPTADETHMDFRQKYRRLFSNLNRYAKATDKGTNIIMDEDDAFAIVTRRLITEYEFFQWAGPQRESQKVNTKSKNLRASDVQFTSLETLYDMNIELLSSRARENRGWGGNGEDGEELSSFIRFRPSDEYLDGLYRELVMYWDAILNELPDLQRPPNEMRTHNPSEAALEAGTANDHLLFWPVGQLLLAAIVRQLLDLLQVQPEVPTALNVSSALRGLGQLEWRLHHAPWRNFLLVKDDRGKWKMRSEDRKSAIRVGQRLQQWVLGLDELDEDAVEEYLHRPWETMLSPQPPEEERAAMWQIVVDRRAQLLGD